ncbi:hypothetical protein BX616_003990 [Lobosporangium transversale]|uniref:MYND-type domain-containing protein n=1 Tax=Lobosporangium transversale TaxID=64571 RepID=A0A1Y2GJ73_9FUNG|nr:hypothetical protein BCR41DRAFT_356137 [Lobosporangium transversale]KAF9916358.1 hypothetical protein BX616_003990 [Lobosporangium transversale]ORZ12467.1 hypothetical protein BCR41DRAFT_356137 [Lobosporangium transversale]|eukprot:XP_021880086.1 hypothetical protein BCR41DRAFT_356137 [Lobosporangium transversale]
MTEQKPQSDIVDKDTFTVADITEKTHNIELNDEEKANDHVHDENCKHEHTEVTEPQGRNDYDLLELRGTKDQTGDPLVKTYFEAKKIFLDAMERLSKIPEGSDPELIEKHKDEIVSITSDLMKAFLMDEKACAMSQRVLKLAEQYEAYVQKYNPEGTSTSTGESEEPGAEQQTTIYTRDSVVFVIWILFSGQQFAHCQQTLGFAIKEFETLRPRMLEFRANCHMAMRDYKACTEDLEQVLQLTPELIEIHSMLGNVYYATHQAQNAIQHFKAFVEAAHTDSRTLPNAYYALANLTLQTAPSGAAKKKSNQALKQAAVLKEAQQYYQKAQEADVRFKELYGVSTALNEIKRTAIMAFQARSAGRNGILTNDPTPALLEASETLKKSFKNPAISHCANCGRPDNVANDDRSPELKPKPLIKCNKCNKVAYCSRPCQIKHWNSTHKNTCNKK